MHRIDCLILGKRFRVYEGVRLEIKHVFNHKNKIKPTELSERKWISLAFIFVFANCSIHILKKRRNFTCIG